MILCLVFIILGYFYRSAIIIFFLLFSYTELLDVSNYLNHYYLVTLLAFIMIFLPMNASFSLDARKLQQSAFVPRWTLWILRIQVGLVYFFAGLSKLKYDWLIRAEPMKIWLGTCQNMPILGKLLAMPIMAYLFSWLGMLFDLSAPFLLLNKKTRPYEYLFIVIFHVITMWLFYIGIFPLVMMGVALIFFSPKFHQGFMQRYFSWLNSTTVHFTEPYRFKNKNYYPFLFGVYLLWQTMMPLRYLLYKGNVLWTEQGYRYAWNVMLMEKDGSIEFYVKDNVTGEQFIEYPKKHLTGLQEKMMSTQPDLILQYAHFLSNTYRQKLKHPVSIYADSYVSLNRKPGKVFIDPKIDLAEEHDNLLPKQWILADK